MATWKNFEFKMWLKEINASCLSQEKLKLEAMKFSEKFDNVDKKTISKICDDFEKEHKKIWKEASYDIFEEMGGTDGKMRGRKDVPPNNYFPKDQSDLKMIKVEKNMETKCEDCNIKMSSNVEVKAHIKNENADAIKKAFSKEVMSRVPSQSKYLDWLKKDTLAARNPWLKGGFLLSLVFRFCLILPIFSLWQTFNKTWLVVLSSKFLLHQGVKIHFLKF